MRGIDFRFKRSLEGDTIRHCGGLAFIIERDDSRGVVTKLSNVKRDTDQIYTQKFLETIISVKSVQITTTR